MVLVSQRYRSARPCVQSDGRDTLRKGGHLFAFPAKDNLVHNFSVIKLLGSYGETSARSQYSNFLLVSNLLRSRLNFLLYDYYW